MMPATPALPLPVGLLALQGDYEMHRRMLARLGRETVAVRRPDELAQAGALIVPGGESTTLSRLIDRNGLREPLLAFAAAGKPILGTCAGLIMLSRGLVDEAQADWHGVRPLGLLDVTVRRNGYGRQVDSFTEPVRLEGSLAVVAAEAAAGGAPAVDGTLPVVYIRAPRIDAVGPAAEVIARRPGGEIVGVRQGRVVGLTFHPELGEDGRFHRLLAVA
ncbi:MAG: pyridoxal 5'-phosphate synthase glutaminase subunit PdxT [Candidatus Krumholzibacteria bacterium]|jgi:5'-phosphate synthase pdxT subunit|nr:pyridoxal 5'-phosphate synthase glutaminase subunit PdxT [Candidatus Krumholzibacteria bacterium]